MILKGIIDTDFVNYRKICMILEFPNCSFKCDKECGEKVCQNSSLADAPTHYISMDKIIESYLNNPLTEAIVFQGLEPFDSVIDLIGFIRKFRKISDDDIVIYTGYNKNELKKPIGILSKYKNIIIKFGRYIPHQKPHYDKILGVNLASDNQYAERIN